MKSATSEDVQESTERKKAQTPPPTGKRLNIILPEKAFSELRNLATETNRTMTDVLRMGISLAHIAISEEGHGRKLAIVDHEGKLVKELVFLR